MKFHRPYAALLVALFTVSIVLPLPAVASDVSEVREATAVLREITRIPEKSIPPSLLSNARGIAIIPSLIKVGFVFGGRHGSGVLLVRDDSGKWSDPLEISMTGGSVGWQIGVQSTDVILVFKTRKSIDGVRSSKFTLGADASVAAGPVGRHAEAATDITLRAEVYSYSRNRGLFAGVALEGAVLQVGHKLHAPAATKTLKSVLRRHAR